ncbi:MAG: hypothetical protein ACLQDY_13155 [Streptosporangiaceae bacterium]
MLSQAGTPPHSNFSGSVYVATPQLLATYGIKASQIAPHTDVLTTRPGLAGLPHMEMIWQSSGNGSEPDGRSEPDGNGGPSCTLSNDCLASPAMQTISNLPGGTSAPNTVITEYAVRKYHLQTHLSGWLIQAPAPLTAAQIRAVRRVALADEAPLETASGGPDLGEIAGGGTALGIVIALSVLAMSGRPDPQRDRAGPAHAHRDRRQRHDAADDHCGDRRRARPARRDPRHVRRGDRRPGVGAQQPVRHVQRRAADRRADPAGRAAAGRRGRRLAAGRPRA